MYAWAMKFRYYFPVTLPKSILATHFEAHAISWLPFEPYWITLEHMQDVPLPFSTHKSMGYKI